MRSPIFIAGAVALLHVGGFVALQSRLMLRTDELIVPVEMLSQIIEPPQPALLEAPPAPASKLFELAKQSKAESLPPAPQPFAVADPTPAPNAPVVAPAAPAPSSPNTGQTAAASSSVPTAVAATPIPEKVTEPEIAAEHKANEALFRPPQVSSRLGEFGTVVLNVTVGVDGRAREAIVSQSSGFTRLDKAAVRGAMLARFKPATRSGIPIERKFLWPIIYPEPTS